MARTFNRIFDMRCLALVLGFAGALTQQSVAALPTNLFSGSTAFAFSGNGSSWCSIQPGISMFQRGGTSPMLRISLPEITYYDAGVYYSYSGQAVLRAGKALFDNPAKPLASPPAITGYKNGYNSVTGILRVQFTLVFPNCSLNIASTYRS